MRVQKGYVVNNAKAVVGMVVKQAQQLKPRFIVSTSIQQGDMQVIRNQLARLERFYTEVHTQYVMKGDRIVQIEFIFRYLDSYAILQVYKGKASKVHLTQKQRQIYERAKELVLHIIKPNMTDYQKEYAIDKYLLMNCIYDKEAATCMNQHDVRYADSYTPYGVLFRGRAVCDGYAQTAAIMLTLAGLSVYILRSETHAWNLVKIEGNYYHLDSTWNSTTKSHEFFNLCDDVIRKYPKHDWKSKEFYPRATAITYNYYVYNNLVVCDLNTLERVIRTDIKSNKKRTSVWIAGFRIGKQTVSVIMNHLNQMGYHIASYGYTLPTRTKEEYSNLLTITYESN